MTSKNSQDNEGGKYFTIEELREYVKDQEPIVAEHLEVYYFKEIIKQVETLSYFFDQMSRDERFERFEIITKHAQKITEKGLLPSPSDYDNMDYLGLIVHRHNLDQMLAELETLRRKVRKSSRAGNSANFSLKKSLTNMGNRVKTATIGFCDSLKKRMGMKN